MNVFGAFTFGALIKTFLPGFVWLVAFVLGEAQIAPLFGWRSLSEIALEHESLAAVLAVPASILFGLGSNILVFIGVNDELVREPMRRRNKELFDFHEELSAILRAKCWKTIGCLDDLKQGSFREYLDTEQILLHKIGVPALAYIREQYWFHLEFQMNLFLSIIAMSGAVFLYFIQLKLYSGILTLLPAAICCAILISAARKNYCRHIEKMASMMVAVLSAPDKETSPLTKGPSTNELVSKFRKP